MTVILSHLKSVWLPNQTLSHSKAAKLSKNCIKSWKIQKFKFSSQLSLKLPKIIKIQYFSSLNNSFFYIFNTKHHVHRSLTTVQTRKKEKKTITDVDTIKTLFNSTHPRLNFTFCFIWWPSKWICAGYGQFEFE